MTGLTRSKSKRDEAEEMKIHPQIIEKEGRKEFVILPYDEFVRIQEALEDYKDLRDLRNAKADDEGGEAISLAEARRMVSENPEGYPHDQSS